MALKLSLNRVHTFEYDEGDEQFKVTFEFPYSEDLDRLSIRKLLNKKYGKIEFKADKDGKENDPTDEELEYLSDMSNIIMRKALVSMESKEGIEDENGNLIKLKNDDGSINEQVQKAMFEYVKSKTELYTKILMAYVGPKSKNLKTGVTQ